MLRTCGKARRFSPSIATLPAAAYSQVCWTGATSVSEEHAPVLGIMRLACCSLSEIRSPAKNAERQDFMSRGLNQRYLSACLYRILGHAEPYCIEASANSLCTLNPWGHTVRIHTLSNLFVFSMQFSGRPSLHQLARNDGALGRLPLWEDANDCQLDRR